MTYQELLDEFCKRMLRSSQPFSGEVSADMKTDDLEWAMQALLEKLRDEREGPK